MKTILILCLFGVHVWAEGPIVVTTKGPVMGQTSSDGEYDVFFGIPYAKVDETNPFGAALEYPAFETTYEATDSSIKCPQYMRGQNDGVIQCLVLNVYVPKSVNTTHPAPVLMWIHGGGFSGGSGGGINARRLASHGVVVVTINYRLGPYGFLCLNDPRVPGNQGLKDQLEAIKWVKRNIAAFGGNPDDLTVGGESAGAGSTALHMYRSEKLFDKAIMSSGSPYVEGMFVKADHEAAIKIAKQMGHEVKNTRDALNILNESDPTDVVKAFSELDMELRPCQEKKFRGAQNFVTVDPFHLHSNNFKDYKILIGYSSKEEYGRFARKSDEDFETDQTMVYDKLKKNFNFPTEELNALSRIVYRFYFGSKAVSTETMLAAVDFESDFIMNKAVEMSVNEFLEQGNDNLYKFIFSYVRDELANVTGAGAGHTADIEFLFDRGTQQSDDDDEVRVLLRNRMTTMWTNFIKYGNPTPSKTELLPVTWTPVTRTSHARPYLDIDRNLEVRQDVYHERISFWELFYENYWMNSVLADRRH